VKATLIVESGPEAGAQLALPADRPTVLGRAAHVDLVIPDIHVSKTHCHFVLSGHRWTVTDLNSSNGTFVNDRRVNTQALSDGDVLRLGKTTLRFVVQPSPERGDQPKNDRGLFKLL